MPLHELIGDVESHKQHIGDARVEHQDQDVDVEYWFPLRVRMDYETVKEVPFQGVLNVLQAAGYLDGVLFVIYDRRSLICADRCDFIFATEGASPSIEAPYFSQLKTIVAKRFRNLLFAVLSIRHEVNEWCISCRIHIWIVETFIE